MSIGSRLRFRPARDFDEARAAFEAMAARDGAEISAPGRSRMFESGRRTHRAVVLLHGLTNAPEQWVPFARRLHAAGDTVVVPRFPGHGYADRATRAIARVGADELLTVASEAVDIASGAGERVTLAGLSIGASIAAWLALARDDVSFALAIVPFVGVAKLGETGNRALARSLVTFPNAFVPWDPSGANDQIPPYAYAKFPTRVLGACLDIGLDALRAAKERAVRGRLDVVLNAREPACNNALSRELFSRVAARRPDIGTIATWSDLPAIHDIIDPTNPHARTDLVYPRLLATIEAS